MGKEEDVIDVAIARIPILRELARKVAKKEQGKWARRGWTKPGQQRPNDEKSLAQKQAQQDLFPRPTPKDMREVELRDRGLPPDSR